MALSLLLFSNSAGAEKTVLKVGYIPGTGFLEEDWQGHIRGYGYEYMEFLSNYGEWSFVYIPSITWQECNNKLQSGAIDLLPAMPGSYLSLTNVKRTDHVIGRLPMEIVSHSPTVAPHMRLGNIPANPPLPSLPKVAEQEGFTYELVNYPLFYDMEEAFQAGAIDGYIAPMLKSNKPEHTLALFDRQSYRLLVRPDRTELLAAMNAAMDQMLMEQPGIRDRLNDKYNRTGGAPLVLTRQEREYLEQKKKLRAAIMMPDKPYAYMAGEVWEGVIPGAVAQMSEDLGIEIEILPTQSREESAQLIKSGQVDFVADAVCDFSWAKEFNMIPTQSYLHLEYVPVKREGTFLDDTSRVACVEDFLYTKVYIAPRYDKEHRVTLDNMEECFRAVSEGRADVLYAPRSEIPYFLAETDTYNLEVEPETVFSDTISLGVYKHADSRLWRILNKEINHLDENKIRSIINKTIQNDAHISLQWLIYHHPRQVMAVMLLIIVLVGLLYWEKSSARKRQMREIEKYAFTDRVYGMRNLNWLEQELARQQKKLTVENADAHIYLAMFCLEEKAASLAYGQDIYDEEFKIFAENLKQASWFLAYAVGREARELAALGYSKDAGNFVRELRNYLRAGAYREAHGARLWLPLRVGVAEVKGGESFAVLAEQAHAAGLEANRLRQDIYLFDENLATAKNTVQQIVASRTQAMDNGEFIPWYQTIVDINTKTPVGAEALVRWNHPEMGMLLPESFLPIFELDGFIIAMDYYMLDMACKLQKRRHYDGKPMLPLSIRQSCRHLEEADYLEKMQEKYKAYDLSPGMIDLEFAAADFATGEHPERNERAKNILKGLKNLGYTVTLDYFSQTSSLEAMYSLPIDTVKLAPSLLEQHNADILTGVSALGRERGIRVVVLGVENKFQAERVEAAKCRFVQGFLYTRPLPEKEWLSSLGNK